MAFAPIYECANCGYVWRVEIVEFVDCEHDEVYREAVCVVCGDTVCQKYTEIDGETVPECHALTDDEIAEEAEWVGDEEDDGDCYESD